MPNLLHPYLLCSQEFYVSLASSSRPVGPCLHLRKSPTMDQKVSVIGRTPNFFHIISQGRKCTTDRPPNPINSTELSTSPRFRDRGTFGDPPTYSDRNLTALTYNNVFVLDSFKKIYAYNSVPVSGSPSSLCSGDASTSAQQQWTWDTDAGWMIDMITGSVYMCRYMQVGLPDSTTLTALVCLVFLLILRAGVSTITAKHVVSIKCVMCRKYHLQQSTATHYTTR